MSVAIIIPSMDNRAYLEPCLESLQRRTMGVDCRVIVVNNGRPDSCLWIEDPLVDVVGAGRNRGWTGGLALGLAHCNDPFVCFLNDDTRIPIGQERWLEKLLTHFAAGRVGAVGPASNCTIGVQSVFDEAAKGPIQAPFLVGFCMLVRRSALEEAGGVDASLPGGDDIDLSIRLLKKSYLLLCDRSVFVYHHGFVTGTKVYGPATTAHGWNSREYSWAVVAALVEKHGHAGLKLIGWEA